MLRGTPQQDVLNPSHIPVLMIRDLGRARPGVKP